MQRPQFGLQPRHLYTAPGVRGQIPLLTISLIFVSLRTLQEHTIIKTPVAETRDAFARGSLTQCRILHKTRMRYYNNSKAKLFDFAV